MRSNNRAKASLHQQPQKPNHRGIGSSAVPVPLPKLKLKSIPLPSLLVSSSPVSNNKRCYEEVSSSPEVVITKTVSSLKNINAPINININTNTNNIHIGTINNNINDNNKENDVSGVNGSVNCMEPPRKVTVSSPHPIVVSLIDDHHYYVM
jgi:hypothetical protein